MPKSGVFLLNNLHETIESLCEKKGIKPGKMCNDLGLSRSLMTDLRSGRKTGINASTASKIAKYFDVSVDYLLGESAKPQKEKAPAGSGGLTESDRNLIRAYHQASVADRQIIDNIVSRYLPGSGESVQPMKPVPLFGTSAAAGPGEPDTGLPWENYEVPEDSRAEFAVRITGDSMTPVLADGEIALCVKRRPQVGDLAVIMVNGALLVKQYIRDNYGNVYLRSLNRARRDCDYDIMASSNDTAMCYGIVLLAKRVPLVDQ